MLALFLVIAGLGLIGWLSARMRAVGFRRGSTARFSSLPSHFGGYVALWTVLPAALFLTIWASSAPALVTDQVLRDPAAAQLPPPGFDRAAILSEARSLASGNSFGAFNPLSQKLAPAYAAAQARFDWIRQRSRIAVGIRRRSLCLHASPPGISVRGARSSMSSWPACSARR